MLHHSVTGLHAFPEDTIRHGATAVSSSRCYVSYHTSREDIIETANTHVLPKELSYHIRDYIRDHQRPCVPLPRALITCGMTHLVEGGGVVE